MRGEIIDALLFLSVICFDVLSRFLDVELQTLSGYTYAPDFTPSSASWRTCSASSLAVSLTLAAIVVGVNYFQRIIEDRVLV